MQILNAVVVRTRICSSTIWASAHLLPANENWALPLMGKLYILNTMV